MNQFSGFSPGNSPSFVHADIHLLGFQPFSPSSALVQQKPPALSAPPPHIVQQAQHKAQHQSHQQALQRPQQQQQLHAEHPPLSEHLRVPPLSFARPAAFVSPAAPTGSKQLPPAASTLLRAASSSQPAVAPASAGCTTRGSSDAGPRGPLPSRPPLPAKITLTEFLQRAQAMQDRALRLWAEENHVLQRGTELQIISPCVAATVSPKRPRCGAASTPRSAAAYCQAAQLDVDVTCHVSSPTGRRDDCDSPVCCSPLALGGQGGGHQACSPNVLDSLAAYLMQPGSTPASALRAGPFSGQFSSHHGHGILFDSAGAVLAALSHLPEGGGGAGDDAHGPGR